MCTLTCGLTRALKVCTHLLPHTFGADAGPTCLRESWGMLGSPQAARLQFRQLQLTKLAHSAYVEGRLDGIAISPTLSVSNCNSADWRDPLPTIAKGRVSRRRCDAIDAMQCV